PVPVEEDLRYRPPESQRALQDSRLKVELPPRDPHPHLIRPLERELSLEVGLRPLDRCLSVLDRDREAGALVGRSQDKGRLQVFRAVLPLRVGVQPCFYFLEILLTEVFGQARYPPPEMAAILLILP